MKTNGDASKISLFVTVGGIQLETTNTIKSREVIILTYTLDTPVDGKIEITYDNGGQTSKSFYLGDVTIN